MAKAFINCAAGCGAKITVVGRTRRDADYQASKASARGWTCRDCLNEQAAERAAAAGLPELNGTEKQVKWAVSLRERFLALSGSVMREATSGLPVSPWSPVKDEIEALRGLIEQVGAAAVEAALAEARLIVDAHEWIERREDSVAQTLYGLVQARRAAEQAATPEAEALAEIAREAAAEAVLRPVAPKTETIAEIACADRRLTVAFPEKRDDFREIVKDRGFKWHGDAWLRVLDGVTSGDPVDRVAEIAHTLLAEGFVVRVHNGEARRRAAEGAFEPEGRRWVKRVLGQRMFVLVWPRSEDFYRAFKSLRGARYSNGECRVLGDSADEVLDFAGLHGFCLSPGARELVDEVMAERAMGTVVDAKRRTVEQPRQVAIGRPQPLAVPAGVEIDDDLRDDI